MKKSYKIMNKLKKSVCFIGYYGHQNTGDDAFCEVSAWGAKKYWKTGKIEFLSSSLPALKVPANVLLKKQPSFKGENLLRVARKILGRPVVIFSGGSVFHSSPRSWPTKKILFESQKIWPFFLGAIGVSIGPFRCHDDQVSVREQLCKLNFLSLRDKASYNLACEMNLPYKPVESFDLAAMLIDIYGKTISKPQTNTRVLGVSVCKYESYIGKDTQAEARRIENTIKTLFYISKACKIKIKFLVFNGHDESGDRKLTEQIAAQLAGNAEVEIVEYSKSPEVMWNAIGSCNAFLATRLHAGIFSYFTETPFVLIEYHKKCSDFLENINYPSDLLVGDYAKVPETVADRILTLLRNEYKVNFTPDIFKEKAKRNFTELFKTLEK